MLEDDGKGWCWRMTERVGVGRMKERVGAGRMRERVVLGG